MRTLITGIYKIVSPTNRVYIGQSKDIIGRFNRYYKMHIANKTQIKLWRSFEKHGVNKHEFCIVEECDSSVLNERERYWQDYYNVLSKNGLNCVLQETNNIKRGITIDHLNKISGENHWTKRKPFSEETKLKMSNSKRGKRASGETRDKLRKIKLGKNNHFYGKKHKPSSKLKMSISAKNRSIQLNSIKIYQCNKQGEFIEEWNSITKAAINYEISPSGITACARGRQKTAAGFKWKYKLIKQ